MHYLMLLMLPVSDPSLHRSSWLATIWRSASSSRVSLSNCSSWKNTWNHSFWLLLRISVHKIILQKILQHYPVGKPFFIVFTIQILAVPPTHSFTRSIDLRCGMSQLIGNGISKHIKKFRPMSKSATVHIEPLA